MTNAAGTQRWVIDSIEEGIASVEVDGHTMITVPIALLPASTAQGQILSVRVEQDRGAHRSIVTLTYDDQATRDARAASAAQVRKGVRQANDPGGDIKL